MANEADSAEAFIEQVLSHCTGFKSVQFFAVIDNVSRDGTLDILLKLAEQNTNLSVVWAPENRCVVDAYVRGYKEALYAGCDRILEIDAGFSHQPCDIPKFFEKMELGYDCVFGSRFCSSGKITNSSPTRYFVSLFGGMLTNLMLGTKLSDMTSGFELFSREALQTVLKHGIQSRGHFFQTEIKVRCRKMNVAEVPIHYRSASPSVNSFVIWDALKNLFRLFRMRLTGSL
ncbi:MAG: glycosyltransferase [Microcoleus sp. SIO2G3]|nr:glycosyltransferase [Microcoleus sp. SIO2G3]